MALKVFKPVQTFKLWCREPQPWGGRFRVRGVRGSQGLEVSDSECPGGQVGQWVSGSVASGSMVQWLGFIVNSRNIKF